MEKEILCGKCKQLYSQTNQPRLLTMCGHTFCQACIKSLITKKKDGKFKIICPEDAQFLQLQTSKVSFFPKNMAIVKAVNKSQIYQTHETTAFMTTSQLNSFSLGINQNSQQKQGLSINSSSGSYYHSQPNGYNDKKSMLTSNINDDNNLCLLHQKPLEIFCVEDLTLICATCAIFGGHKGHNFKQMSQIQAGGKKRQNQLLSLIQKKNVCYKRIQSEKLQKETLKSLQVIKDNMKKDMEQKYKKIYDLLKKWEKQNIEKIDLLSKQMEHKFKNMLQIDEVTHQKYKKWESVALLQVKILQADNIQQKMAILYAHDSLAQNTVIAGKDIIQDITKYEVNIERKIDQSLKNLQVIFNEELLYKLKNVIEVTSSSLQSIKQPLSIQLQVPSTQKFKGKYNSGYESPSMVKTPKRSFQVPFQQQSLLQDDDEEYPNFNHNFSYMSPQQSKTLKQSKSNEDLLKMKKKPTMPPLTKTNRVFSDKNYFISNNQQKKGKTKIPPQYEKIYDSISKDKLEIIDLTGADLEDDVITLILSKIGSNVKTVKLARNRLTDQGLEKIIGKIKNLTIVNLAQNLLSEKSLQTLIEHISQGVNWKSIVLTQNKILQRKHKDKIEKIKEKGIMLTI